MSLLVPLLEFNRLRDEHYSPPGSIFNSLWDHRVTEDPRSAGPTAVAIEIHTLLAGVGAVGCAFLHALWATMGVQGKLALADNDDAGLDFTNLNRYVLVRRKSVGRKKATMAADLLAAATIDFDPHDASVDTLSDIPPRVGSAVGKNTARHAIQLKYPARIFSASTNNLRAEL